MFPCDLAKNVLESSLQQRQHGHLAELYFLGSEKIMLLQCVSHKVVSRKWKTLNSKSDLNGNSKGGALHLYSITLLVILKQFKFEKHWTRKALSCFICHIQIGPVGPMVWTMWPLGTVPSAFEPFIFALSISVEILTGHPGFAAQFLLSAGYQYKVNAAE